MTDGSTITLSPEARVVTVILVKGNCSMIRGEIFDLKLPVPTPMTIIPIMKAAREFSDFVMTGGIAVECQDVSFA